MGNNPVKLPDTVSVDDVTRAVKHFLTHVKGAMAVRKRIW